MSEQIVIAVFGLLGALIGSGITVISQLLFDWRKESKDRKVNCIKNINIMPVKLYKLLNIVNVIIDFIKTDFSGTDNENFNEIYGQLSNLYNNKYPYFWDMFIQDIYILLPNTPKTLGFQILNKIIIETKDMSEKINDYLESEKDIISGLKELQNSFSQSHGNYCIAKHTIYKLLNEYYSIISKNINIMKEMKDYYKKNKTIINTTIKEWKH